MIIEMFILCFLMLTIHASYMPCMDLFSTCFFVLKKSQLIYGDFGEI